MGVASGRPVGVLLQIQSTDPDSRVIRQTPITALHSTRRRRCGAAGMSGAVRTQRILRDEKLALSVVPIARPTGRPKFVRPRPPLPFPPSPSLASLHHPSVPPHPGMAARSGASISPCFAHLRIWKWEEGGTEREREREREPGCAERGTKRPAPGKGDVIAGGEN